jgi:hypothetical protein
LLVNIHVSQFHHWSWSCMHKAPNHLPTFTLLGFTINCKITCSTKLPITYQHSHHCLPTLVPSPIITNANTISWHSLRTINIAYKLPSHVQAMFTSCHLHSKICKGKFRSYLLCCPCSNFYLGPYFHFWQGNIISQSNAFSVLCVVHVFFLYGCIFLILTRRDTRLVRTIFFVSYVIWSFVNIVCFFNLVSNCMNFWCGVGFEMLYTTWNNFIGIEFLLLLY